jgi:hypothetical protein
VAVTSALSLLTIDPATYVNHPLHRDDRDWPETNCYVDLWVELLHALGLEPLAPLAFTLGCDFDGEQWEFFKYPPEDLRTLFGIEVHEMNLWRMTEDHIEQHLALDHLLTIEADSWFLPDTAGVSYRLGHQKTTIVPHVLDRPGRRLRYFHNRGYHELQGEDYVGALRIGAGPAELPPYAELVNLDRLQHPDETDLRAAVDPLVRFHLARRPATNPLRRLAGRITSDVAWLQAQDAEVFHGYAFGTLRQCGAWAATLSSFLTWLDRPELHPAVDSFDALSAAAKTCQFMLARLVRGRAADLDRLFEEMARHWEAGYQVVIDSHGG